VPHRRRGGDPGGDLGIEHLEDDHRPRRAVVEDIADLLRLVEEVQRDDDRAEAQDGVVGDDELREIRHHQRHPIALGDPARGERVGDLLDQAIRLRVAESLLPEDDRRPLAVTRGDIGDDFGEGRCGCHRSPP
jgi:hypothetical protein